MVWPTLGSRKAKEQNRTESQRSEIGCLPYFHTWCGHSVNLECKSETCCARLAEIQDAKNRQKVAIWAPSTTLSGYIFATKACIYNRKKLLSSNISSICRHNMVNFGLLAAGICWRVWGTPANFSGFAYWQRYCTAL